MKWKSPSSRSLAHAGLASPVASAARALDAATARIITTRASHGSAQSGDDIAEAERDRLFELVNSSRTR
jgi:hypothetical protein